MSSIMAGLGDNTTDCLNFTRVMRARFAACVPAWLS